MNPISSLLAQWYLEHHRPLPWRQSTDPYIIWVSEVILQQTRVDQGLEYFLRFVEKWPDLQSLASANEDEVLRMWQGLGYYSRARNLLAGARQVVSEYGGVVPSEYDKLIKIKGIGPYTAAAIASIAFDRPVAVVDGNVARVISRLFAIDQAVNTSSGERLLREAAAELLDTSNPGRHNQAMMELGALVCTPRNPSCNECVLNHHCLARQKNIQANLPVKLPRKPVRTRWFNYLVVRVQTARGSAGLLMQKRTADDIWKGLYEFPLIESEHEIDEAELHQLVETQLDLPGRWHYLRCLRTRPHQLTHQRIMPAFFEFELHTHVDINLPNGLSLADLQTLSRLPLPRLIEGYLKESEILNA
ncbi:MAG: A/G-specific adenine glycosylase [Bacteroidetes bacterium]|nr:A/G-specific adenine glycosylase [Bacteroidota bacterium]